MDANESRIKPGNFVTIQDWMPTSLNLSGNELLIYAIIYGFSQIDGQYYYGSKQYLADWCSISIKAVKNILDRLIENGLLLKIVGQPTNKYKAIVPIEITPRKTKNNPEESSILPEESSKTEEESSANNIENNKYIENKEATEVLTENIKEVTKYFNNVFNTSYKTTSTKKFLGKLFKGGYTTDDCKAVVDLKFNQWAQHPFRFKNGRMSTDYIKPSVLFGNYFSEYLYEAYHQEYSSESSSNFESRSCSVDVDPNVSDFVL